MGLLGVTVREPAKESDLDNAGITDLSTLSTEHPRGVSLTAQGPDGNQLGFHHLTPGLLADIKSNNPQFLYLRIDVSYPPTVIKEALDSLLSPRYKKFERARKKLTAEQKKLVAMQIRREKPWTTPFGVETWLLYLRCYDLKKEGGRTDRELGELVYGSRNEQSRQRVVNAIRKVKELIHQAENYLPPFDVFGPTNV